MSSVSFSSGTEQSQTLVKPTPRRPGNGNQPQLSLSLAPPAILHIIQSSGAPQRNPGQERGRDTPSPSLAMFRSRSYPAPNESQTLEKKRTHSSLHEEAEDRCQRPKTDLPSITTQTPFPFFYGSLQNGSPYFPSPSPASQQLSLTPAPRIAERKRTYSSYEGNTNEERCQRSRIDSSSTPQSPWIIASTPSPFIFGPMQSESSCLTSPCPSSQQQTLTPFSGLERSPTQFGYTPLDIIEEDLEIEM